jgi:CMP-N-acetylneuraminic acid synthetase
MKTVAIVPIKSKSERVQGKNFRLVGGKPLFHYLLDKLKSSNFDEVFIDSDSEEIRDYSQNMGYQFIQRKPELSKNSANGNDLLNYHAEIIEADYYFQLFVTSPLTKVETINNCIDILHTNRQHDSILTTRSIFTWFWFEGKPVNYNPYVLPRSQDAKPITMETTGLYGISRQALIKKKARIGQTPYFYEVSDEEAIDLDNEFDFQFLEFYVQKHLSCSDC